MNQMRIFSVKLNDGHLMPTLGFGTSAPNKVSKSLAEEAIKMAIDIGYRHIDSAHLYMNEEEVGRAIQKKIESGTVKREDIFCTSKLWSTYLRPELVQTGLEMTLKKLQLNYVDLYLIHFPGGLKPGKELMPMDTQGNVIFDRVDICATWEILEKCKDAGLVKSIGVSNFNRRQIEKILNKPGLKYKPVCNQVECHPYLNQSKLLEFCKSKDIVLTAFAALGSDAEKDWVTKNKPPLLEDPVIKAIAEKHMRSPAQVALRYQLQRGVVVLAKSFNEKRMKENFQVFDFQLTPEDMKKLDGLNRNIRYLEDLVLAQHPDYPFNDDY
ncbi:aldo-keto reductase family 1 member C1-like isoform X1 [Talpa occidentalis]|uniref:aldo-keto reductase family 1 member C1-like isoform X1 n=1 Tax=Talpa occidentalis TaxID=50954 RepID=UPI00188E91E9|nr:aldo-keto reductase family 1 member C1-like isoform X1 [Talpa occidentalis]